VTVTAIPLGAFLWITTLEDIEVIKRFEERTETRLLCNRGLPVRTALQYQAD
jgi:hypothetical protein